jgi:hypothetical protein
MKRIQIGPPEGAGYPPLMCVLRCVGPAAGSSVDPRDAYLFDDRGGGRADGSMLACAGVVLTTQGAVRAAELLEAGVRRVLLGEAALADSSIVQALAGKYGAERVGLDVPARRIEVSWSFETVSNADFKVLAPSVGAPAWEILRADGTRTGTQALWWIGEMMKLGAGFALLRVDISDDADLNLCADCVERFGERAWIGPLADGVLALEEWVHYGHARQLALPPAAHRQALAIDAATVAAVEAAAARASEMRSAQDSP